MPGLNFCPVTLYFTRPWAGSFAVRSAGRALACLIGSPTHVTVAIGGVAFVVAPGKRGCFQAQQAFYQLSAELRGGVVDIVTVNVPDRKAAMDAAYTYAVGPMTCRRAAWRFVTGKACDLDVDCVLAATKVLRAGGLDVPVFRTPKGLLKWLRQRPLACKS